MEGDRAKRCKANGEIGSRVPGPSVWCGITPKLNDVRPRSTTAKPNPITPKLNDVRVRSPSPPSLTTPRAREASPYKSLRSPPPFGTTIPIVNNMPQKRLSRPLSHFVQSPYPSSSLLSKIAQNRNGGREEKRPGVSYFLLQKIYPLPIISH